MNVALRSALGVLLCAACLGMAVFCALHGIVFGTLLAGFTAALFAWAVYDNRKVAQQRAAMRTAGEDADHPPSALR